MRLGPCFENRVRVGVVGAAALFCSFIAPSVARADGRETSLSDVVQLTRDFERAGEAYFSPDGNWIIFQATPKGEKQYAMYVAKLQRTKAGDITGADTPKRISPPWWLGLERRRRR